MARLQPDTVALISRDLLTPPTAARGKAAAVALPRSRLFRATVIADVPEELLLRIFLFVRRPIDLLRVGLVCRQWRDLVRDPAVWRHSDLWIYKAMTKPVPPVWPLQCLEGIRRKRDRAWLSLPRLRKVSICVERTSAGRSLLTCLKGLRLTDLALLGEFPHLDEAALRLLPPTLTNLSIVARGGPYTVLSQQCPLLQGLRLHRLSDDDIAQLSFPSLVRLQLSSTTATNLCGLSAQFPLLTSLSVVTDDPQDVGLGRLRLPHLQSLEIRRCVGDDATMCAIIEHHPLLHTLQIADCHGVTAAPFSTLSDHCPHLTELDASFSALDNSVIPHLPTTLTSLDVAGTPVTAAGLAALPARCPFLHTLDLDDRLKRRLRGMLRALPLYDNAVLPYFQPPLKLRMDWEKDTDDEDAGDAGEDGGVGGEGGDEAEGGGGGDEDGNCEEDQEEVGWDEDDSSDSSDSSSDSRDGDGDAGEGAPEVAGEGAEEGEGAPEDAGEEEAEEDEEEEDAAAL